MSNQGPSNFARLVSHKAAIIMIPQGTKNAVGVGLQAIVGGGMAKAIREATNWAKQACAVVRTGSEPNPWKAADDETIAAEIMRRVEEKKLAKQ